MSGNNSVSDNAVKTGTTTIGMKIKDGVVLATDQRATMGNLIANSHVQKVYPIADNLGMTISGLVGDAQLMVRYMQSQVSIYEMQKGAQMSVATAATLLGSVIRQGFYLGPILAGYDRTGGHVFSVDGAGGVIEDDYTSSGSGSVTAYGALESLYKPNMTKEQAIDVAIAGLNAARRRDNYTGDGMLILIIGPNGYEWVDQEKIKKRCEEIGFRYPN
ncbi:20S proteasome, alpha and beta subunits [Thermoplasmatales archaeon BRNA1]|nr:20S proteasome, alpha and beta subunits [Thermoplasmatales archaeon BRNA1]